MKGLPLPVRIIIYAVIMLFIVVIYRFTIYSSKVKDIRNRQWRYDQLYTQIVNLMPKATEDKLKAKEQELELAKKAYKKLVDYLPEEMGDYDVIYDELMNLAMDNHIELDIFQAGKNIAIKKTSSFEDKIFFDISMNASFESLVHFFYSLGVLRNILNAESLNIKRSEGDAIIVKGFFSAYRFRTKE